jgi:hypothetical protein
VPEPRPATVDDVVTSTVVEAPAASVTDVPPPANASEEICGTFERVRTAVRDAPLTFVTRKTDENVRAEATVPKSSARLSTPPLASVVFSGVTEK